MSEKNKPMWGLILPTAAILGSMFWGTVIRPIHESIYNKAYKTGFEDAKVQAKKIADHYSTLNLFEERECTRNNVATKTFAIAPDSSAVYINGNYFLTGTKKDSVHNLEFISKLSYYAGLKDGIQINGERFFDMSCKLNYLGEPQERSGAKDGYYSAMIDGFEEWKLEHRLK